MSDRSVPFAKAGGVRDRLVQIVARRRDRVRSRCALREQGCAGAGKRTARPVGGGRVDARALENDFSGAF